VTLGSGTSASGTITLGGNAFSSNDIANFLATLARVPKVSQVSLASSTSSAGSNVVNFQVTAQLTLPAPVAAPATDTTTTTGSQG
jgi:Tfp pilus assembly protein PilN